MSKNMNLEYLTCPSKTKPNIKLISEGKNFRSMYINGPEWVPLLANYLKSPQKLKC